MDGGGGCFGWNGKERRRDGDDGLLRQLPSWTNRDGEQYYRDNRYYGKEETSSAAMEEYCTYQCNDQRQKDFWRIMNEPSLAITICLLLDLAVSIPDVSGLCGIKMTVQYGNIF